MCTVAYGDMLQILMGKLGMLKAAAQSIKPQEASMCPVVFFSGAQSAAVACILG